MNYIDSIIAEKVMGWEHKTQSYYMVSEFDTRRCEPSHGRVNYVYWSPSTNLKDAFEMEEKIFDKGLAIQYVIALSEVIQKDEKLFVSDWYFQFAVLHAKPSQRARAALKTIGE